MQQHGANPRAAGGAETESAHAPTGNTPGPPDQAGPGGPGRNPAQEVQHAAPGHASRPESPGHSPPPPFGPRETQPGHELAPPHLRFQVEWHQDEFRVRWGPEGGPDIVMGPEEIAATVDEETGRLSAFITAHLWQESERGRQHGCWTETMTAWWLAGEFGSAAYRLKRRLDNHGDPGEETRPRADRVPRTCRLATNQVHPGFFPSDWWMRGSEGIVTVPAGSDWPGRFGVEAAPGTDLHPTGPEFATVYQWVLAQRWRDDAEWPDLVANEPPQRRQQVEQQAWPTLQRWYALVGRNGVPHPCLVLEASMWCEPQYRYLSTPQNKFRWLQGIGAAIALLERGCVRPPGATLSQFRLPPLSFPFLTPEIREDEVHLPVAEYEFPPHTNYTVNMWPDCNLREYLPVSPEQVARAASVLVQLGNAFLLPGSPGVPDLRQIVHEAVEVALTRTHEANDGVPIFWGSGPTMGERMYRYAPQANSSSDIVRDSDSMSLQAWVRCLPTPPEEAPHLERVETAEANSVRLIVQYTACDVVEAALLELPHAAAHNRFMQEFLLELVGRLSASRSEPGLPGWAYTQYFGLTPGEGSRTNWDPQLRLPQYSREEWAVYRLTGRDREDQGGDDGRTYDEWLQRGRAGADPVSVMEWLADPVVPTLSGSSPLRERLRQAETNGTAMELELEGTKQELREASEECHRLHGQLRETQRQQEALQHECDSLNREVAVARHAHEALQHRCASLRRDNEQLEYRSQVLRAELDHQGALGAVAQVAPAPRATATAPRLGTASAVTGVRNGEPPAPASAASSTATTPAAYPALEAQVLVLQRQVQELLQQRRPRQSGAATQEPALLGQGQPVPGLPQHGTPRIEDRELWQPATAPLLRPGQPEQHSGPTPAHSRCRGRAATPTQPLPPAQSAANGWTEQPAAARVWRGNNRHGSAGGGGGDPGDSDDSVASEPSDPGSSPDLHTPVRLPTNSTARRRLVCASVLPNRSRGGGVGALSARVTAKMPVPPNSEDEAAMMRWVDQLSAAQRATIETYLSFDAAGLTAADWFLVFSAPSYLYELQAVHAEADTRETRLGDRDDLLTLQKASTNFKFPHGTDTAQRAVIATAAPNAYSNWVHMFDHTLEVTAWGPVRSVLPPRVRTAATLRKYFQTLLGYVRKINTATMLLLQSVMEDTQTARLVREGSLRQDWRVFLVELETELARPSRRRSETFVHDSKRSLRSSAEAGKISAADRLTHQLENQSKLLTLRHCFETLYCPGEETPQLDALPQVLRDTVLSQLREAFTESQREELKWDFKRLALGREFNAGTKKDRGLLPVREVIDLQNELVQRLREVATSEGSATVPGLLAPAPSGGAGKSDVCFQFRDTGSCTFGARCRFSHGTPTNPQRNGASGGGGGGYGGGRGSGRGQGRGTRSSTVCAQWRTEGQCSQRSSCADRHSMPVCPGFQHATCTSSKDCRLGQHCWHSYCRAAYLGQPCAAGAQCPRAHEGKVLLQGPRGASLNQAFWACHRAERQPAAQLWTMLSASRGAALRAKQCSAFLTGGCTGTTCPKRKLHLTVGDLRLAVAAEDTGATGLDF